jgi:hypothetical protein
MAVEVDYWSRSYGKSRSDGVGNDEVRGKTDIERTTVYYIDKRKLLWFGHVKRMLMDRWAKTALDWIPPGRQERERPRRRWTQGIEGAVTARNLQEREWQERKPRGLGAKKRRQPMNNFALCTYNRDL